MAAYTKGFKTSNTMDGNRYKTTIWLDTVNGKGCNRKIDVDIKINIAGFYPEPTLLNSIEKSLYNDLIDAFKLKFVTIKNILEYYADDYGRRVVVYEDLCDNRIRLASLYLDENREFCALKHDSYTGFIKKIEPKKDEK